MNIMKIEKAYCFFEQSGVFRDAFRSFGIPAECYDIDNQDGQTDHIVDLFDEIDKAFHDRPSIIDDITPKDITIAFFPCIHFEQFACMFYQGSAFSMRNWPEKKKALYAADKFDKCAIFFRHLKKMWAVFTDRGLRLVIENPIKGYSLLNYLLVKPQFIDWNRSLTGDCYVKPTAYWFINCSPEQGSVIDKNKNFKKIEKTKSSSISGVCSLERSRIEPKYARNFIATKLIGLNVKNSQTFLEL